MDRVIILITSAAVMALGACSKNKNQSEGAIVSNSQVVITQAAPPHGGTWADVVNATSAGGFLMGNPNAKVRLVEIGSFSCSFCKQFEDEGAPLLVERFVKTGQVSWEFRLYVDTSYLDVAANIIARCSGVKTFFPLAEALYKDQPTFLNKIDATPQDKISQIENLPTNQAFVQMASLLGLQDWAAARGVPPAQSNQCLSDEKNIDREVHLTTNVRKQYTDFFGTPTFIINGKMLPKEVASWDKLEPRINAALS